MVRAEEIEAGEQQRDHDDRAQPAQDRPDDDEGRPGEGHVALDRRTERLPEDDRRRRGAAEHDRGRHQRDRIEPFARNLRSLGTS